MKSTFPAAPVALGTGNTEFDNVWDVAAARWPFPARAAQFSRISRGISTQMSNGKVSAVWRLRGFSRPLALIVVTNSINDRASIVWLCVSRILVILLLSHSPRWEWRKKNIIISHEFVMNMTWHDKDLEIKFHNSNLKICQTDVGKPKCFFKGNPIETSNPTSALIENACHVQKIKTSLSLIWWILKWLFCLWWRLTLIDSAQATYWI